MLTVKREDYDQVNGLNRGADDYVGKPFTPMVLKARIEAVLRRCEAMTTSEKADTLNYGKLFILELNRLLTVI